MRIIATNLCPCFNCTLPPCRLSLCLLMTSGKLLELFLLAGKFYFSEKFASLVRELYLFLIPLFSFLWHFLWLNVHEVCRVPTWLSFTMSIQLNLVYIDLSYSLHTVVLIELNLADFSISSLVFTSVISPCPLGLWNTLSHCSLPSSLPFLAFLAWPTGWTSTTVPTIYG